MCVAGIRVVSRKSLDTPDDSIGGEVILLNPLAEIS